MNWKCIANVSWMVVQVLAALVFIKLFYTLWEWRVGIIGG